tara:strand:- start:1813 stop:1998 length:186 start_codon:yes stop_codon:yes gene_type:complete
MKKVANKEVQEADVQPETQAQATKITYSIEDMNQLLSFLSQQKFADVAGLIEMLKTKGELS